MLRSEDMTCMKIQSSVESIENIMFEMGKRGIFHFEDLNYKASAEKPFLENLKRCDELEQRIKELKRIIKACGSTSSFTLFIHVYLHLEGFLRRKAVYIKALWIGFICLLKIHFIFAMLAYLIVCFTF